MNLIQRLGLILVSITCLVLSASAQTASAPAATQDVLLTVSDGLGGETNAKSLMTLIRSYQLRIS